MPRNGLRELPANVKALPYIIPGTPNHPWLSQPKYGSEDRGRRWTVNLTTWHPGQDRAVETNNIFFDKNEAQDYISNKVALYKNPLVKTMPCPATSISKIPKVNLAQRQFDPMGTSTTLQATWRNLPAIIVSPKRTGKRIKRMSVRSKTSCDVYPATFKRPKSRGLAPLQRSISSLCMTSTVTMSTWTKKLGSTGIIPISSIKQVPRDCMTLGMPLGETYGQLA